MEFCKTRICFIAMSDKDVRFKIDPSDGRTCQEWAAQELGVTPAQWAKAVRGYILPERIQFFTGENYTEANVTPRILTAVTTEYAALYGKKPEAYCNGCVVLAEGEIWPPIRTINIADYI